MVEGSIQRLFTLLIFTSIRVLMQYLFIKVVIKHSIKRQILSNVFITLVWYLSAIYSIYNEYWTLFFFVCMWFILVFIINLNSTIKGNYYDSAKIRPKYKIVIAIIGFVFIGLLWLKVVKIYSFLTIMAILLLLSDFIDYNSYSTHYENNIK